MSALYRCAEAVNANEAAQIETAVKIEAEIARRGTMKWRWSILAVILLLLMQIPAHAQQAGPPGPDELKAVLEDESRFGQLLTEVWVLRDILALDLGGNISADTQAFQTLQDRLREQRTTIVETLGAQQNIQFPQTVLSMGDRVAANLERTGVQRESSLGKRLVAASMLFEQATRLASQGSLCSLHPFRAVCSQP
jgi:hypothetical protein